MAIRVFFRSHPRAIALVTSSHALVIRHSSTSSESIAVVSAPSAQGVSGNGAIRCMVDFSALDAVDLSEYRPFSPLPIEGTLGLITIENDVFLCAVTGSTRVATVRPGETVQRIDAVEFYCLNSPDHDNIMDHGWSSHSADSPWQDGSDDGPYDRREPVQEHPCLALKKLLSGGSFYYSGDFDLTNRLQDRSTYNVTCDFDSLDDEFLWNSYMIKPLLDLRTHLADHEREALDSSRILTSAIRGFALSISIPVTISPLRQATSGLPSTLSLISRLSCRRAGTRFNARGIDDDGNVANFVESETLFYYPSGLCFSYTQVRGSVPVFWEQSPGLLPGQQKIQVTRSPEATQPAFDKHFEELERNYGAVHILNLLSESKPGELDLTNRYRYHVRHCRLNGSMEEGGSAHQLLRETEFDFHAQTRGPGGYEAASMVQHLVKDAADGFVYYLMENAEGFRSESKPSVILQQEGVFRTNCLDCLDRTNLIQTLISRIAIEAFLGHHHETAVPEFWMRHSSLWADNGDCLSKIYAGTGALKSSFTRHGKMSLAGAIADARKSATRMYINNFADKSRQNIMDMLLGRLLGQTTVHLYDPINDFVSMEISRRAAEYSSPQMVKIWVGTFNLNGRMMGINKDLSPWFSPGPESWQQAEIVAVGFQEIVELSPQHIMSTDPAVRQRWEQAVKKTLDEQAKKSGTEEYVLLRSGQLVGAALLIFVKASSLAHIKNVEGNVKKTGLSGMAGNKGAVAIRMNYADTRICFVTAHLASGFANYDERNRDYNTIDHGLRFQRNFSIDNHDAVIWMGDFNYRIGLSDEKVRKLIQVGDLETLYENDQLNLQMVAGLTFPSYVEAKITFKPTYRYDIESDDYDTSEKHRIPAWCDRVLWKGHNLRQQAYDAVSLRFSDHRPVYAVFQMRVNVVDEAAKERLSRELYQRRRNEVGGAPANKKVEDLDDGKPIGYGSIASGQSLASSDRRKQWLENGVPARSDIKAPKPDYISHHRRLSNPFSAPQQPDWVPRSSVTRAANDGAADDVRPLERSARAVTLPVSRESSKTSSESRNNDKFARHLRSDGSLAASTKAESSRKPAPPVPRKPAVLSLTAAATTEDASHTGNPRLGEVVAKKPLPPFQLSSPPQRSTWSSNNARSPLSPSSSSSSPAVVSTAAAAATATAAAKARGSNNPSRTSPAMSRRAPPPPSPSESIHPSINARIQRLQLAGQTRSSPPPPPPSSPFFATAANSKEEGEEEEEPGPALPPRRRPTTAIATSHALSKKSNYDNTQQSPPPPPVLLLDTNDNDMRDRLSGWKPLMEEGGSKAKM